MTVRLSLSGRALRDSGNTSHFSWLSLLLALALGASAVGCDSGSESGGDESAEGTTESPEGTDDDATTGTDTDEGDGESPDTRDTTDTDSTEGGEDPDTGDPPDDTVTDVVDTTDPEDDADAGDEEDTDTGEPVDCEPATKKCGGKNFQDVLQCNNEGDEYVLLGSCGDFAACDPVTFTCSPKICDPEQIACPSLNTFSICNETGTKLDGPNLCEPQQSCVTEIGCVDWACIPGNEACDEDGVQGICAPSGLEVFNYTGCFPETLCVLCAGIDVVATCAGVETGGKPELITCGEGLSCVEGIGCQNWICEPGTLGCGGDGSLYRCALNGQSYNPLGLCDSPPCDFCLELESVVTCDGGGGDEITPVDETPCAPSTSCIEPSGCIPWNCEPGTVLCTESGAQACSIDGQEYNDLPPSNQGSGLNSNKWCTSGTSFVTCPAGGSEDPIPTEACQAESTCVKGVCQDWVCEPSSVTCAGAQDVVICSVDGLQSNSAYCGVGYPCTTEEDPPGCNDGSGVVGDLYAGCVPLPPYSDAAWVVPANPTVLDIQYSAGLASDGATAFLNLQPVINPFTGEFIEDLTTNTENDSAAGGIIRVFEDGVEVPLTCTALTETNLAKSDVVFAMDITGSMSGTINKVKNSAEALAAFFVNEGLDVQFAVTTFTDDAPAIPATSSSTPFMEFTTSQSELESFLNTINASGGGDAPENPGDAIDFALNNFTFRKGALKVIVVFTDNPMHTSLEGAGSFAKVPFDELLGELAKDSVVHSVTSQVSGPFAPDSPFPSGAGNPVVDVRLLSCLTGGTSSDLNTFQQDAIGDALFAQSLSQSRSCSFPTASPFSPHNVRVEITYEYSGQVLFGEELKNALTYVP